MYCLIFLWRCEQMSLHFHQDTVVRIKKTGLPISNTVSL